MIRKFSNFAAEFGVKYALTSHLGTRVGVAVASNIPPPIHPNTALQLGNDSCTQETEVRPTSRWAALESINRIYK